MGSKRLFAINTLKTKDGHARVGLIDRMFCYEGELGANCPPRGLHWQHMVTSIVPSVCRYVIRYVRVLFRYFKDRLSSFLKRLELVRIHRRRVYRVQVLVCDNVYTVHRRLLSQGR